MIVQSPKKKRKEHIASQKKMILEKARVLFWKNGYDRTSMRDIARYCSMAPGNMYNYFKNKEQILFQVFLEEMDQLISLIKNPKNHPANPVERLKELIRQHVKYTLGQIRTSGLLFDMELRSLSDSNRKKIIQLRDEYEKIMGQIIREGIHTNDFNEIDEKLACYSIASMISRSRIWFSPKGKLSLDEIADFMSSFALKGLTGGKIRSRKPA
jgi:TetR/AcrR family transcriptional regulator, cholesterol catabolism regulator